MFHRLCFTSKLEKLYSHTGELLIQFTMKASGLYMYTTYYQQCINLCSMIVLVQLQPQKHIILIFHSLDQGCNYSKKQRRQLPPCYLALLKSKGGLASNSIYTNQPTYIAFSQRGTASSQGPLWTLESFISFLRKTLTNNVIKIIMTAECNQ